MNVTKVKDEPGYVRDMNSRAILNIDSSGLDAYKKQKLSRLNQKRQIDNLSNDVYCLKQEIAEIRDILVKILNK